MPSRRQSRFLALQALYACHLGGAWEGDVFQRLATMPECGRKAGDAFARSLVEVALEHLEEIDAALAEALEHWRPERLAAVDRALLRLAVCEMFYFPDIPERVTLDEYIELAKLMGDDSTPRFVNGVVDHVLKTRGKNPDGSSAPAAGEETDGGQA